MLKTKNEWSILFKIAFISTILMLSIIPLQIVVYIVSPPPSTAEGFITLFNKSTLWGLLSLDLLYIINTILIVPIYLSFYQLLKNVNKPLIFLAITLGIISIAAYFPSNTSFEVLNLSHKYTLATSEIQRQTLTATVDGMLAIYTGTTFNVYYVLSAITLILFSYVMLKSQIFNKSTAIVGIISGILMIIPSTAGTIGFIFSFLSLIPWIIFSIMIARKFKVLAE